MPLGFRVMCLAVAAAVVAVPVAAQTDSSAGIPEAIALLRRQEYGAAATMLRSLTQREPGNPRVWSLLGFALHQQGELDQALEAHLKATEFEQTAPTAMYNVGMVHALKGDRDRAFEWLLRAKATGRVNLTNIAFDTDAESLRTDPRYARLFPSPEEYADPFLEPGVRVLQEWRGEAQGDEFGWIARNIGDVDGDGINDVTTSAPSHDGGQQGRGKVYTYSAGTGALLWTRLGEPGERLGLGIEAAGDVNADGIPDVVAGAPGGGKSYVFSGRTGETLLTLIAEAPDDLHGRKVSDVGDVNGDGHADILVGAPQNDAAGDDAGRAYLYSGADGAVLLTLTGEAAGDRFGSSAAGVTTGDGTVWLVVGAPNAGPSNGGRTYVYRGLTPDPAFLIEADETGAQLGGMFVSVVGDVNADGTPDIYASDWPNTAKGRSTGRIYVHSGADGARLLTLTGETAGDGFGIGPADAGDVNGDGHDDLVIGAWQHGGAAPSGGKIYVYSGADGALLKTYTGKVPGETLGFDATGMGDVDGDGAIDYLITSAWSAVNGARSGRMYVLSGR